jgi:hypothetical protein
VSRILFIDGKLKELLWILTPFYRVEKLKKAAPDLDALL